MFFLQLLFNRSIVRVRLTFTVKNRGALVPFHHQFLIAREIKEILARHADSDLITYPFYSFSGLKGQTRLGNNGLHFNSRRVTIVVSSASEEFLDLLLKSILDTDFLKIGELVLKPEFADKELPVNLDHGTKYVCISPLILDFSEVDDDFPFVDPASNEFSDLLYESTIERMTEYGIDVSTIQDVQKFQLVPDAGYVNKMKSSGKKYSRIYPTFQQGRRQEVRGYTLPFTLFAAPEIQDFVFTCGLGENCSNGFGLLDLANSNPTERTVTYAVNESSNSAGN